MVDGGEYDIIVIVIIVNRFYIEVYASARARGYAVTLRARHVRAGAATDGYACVLDAVRSGDGR